MSKWVENFLKESQELAQTKSLSGGKKLFSNILDDTFKPLDEDPRLWFTDTEKKIFNTIRSVCVTYDLDVSPRVAGGWVRDKLLDRASDDVDIALENMQGEDFARLVQRYLEEHEAKDKVMGSVAVIKSNPSQSKHLNTAVFNLHGQSIDASNLRTEIYHNDSRIPIVQLGSVRDDVVRRDYTINSMYYNILKDRVEDVCLTGVRDLRRGILRTPLPAFKTFNDDPLRVLRAARFAGRFSFTVTREVERAAAHQSVHRNLVRKVSRERFGLELKKAFEEFGRVPIALAYLCRWGLRPLVFALPPPVLAQGPRGPVVLSAVTVDPALAALFPLYRFTELAQRTALACTHPALLDRILRAGGHAADAAPVAAAEPVPVTPASLREDRTLTSLCWALLYEAHQRMQRAYPAHFRSAKHPSRADALAADSGLPAPRDAAQCAAETCAVREATVARLSAALGLAPALMEHARALAARAPHASAASAKVADADADADARTHATHVLFRDTVLAAAAAQPCAAEVPVVALPLADTASLLPRLHQAAAHLVHLVAAARGDPAHDAHATHGTPAANADAGPVPRCRSPLMDVFPHHFACVAPDGRARAQVDPCCDAAHSHWPPHATGATGATKGASDASDPFAPTYVVGARLRGDAHPSLLALGTGMPTPARVLEALAPAVLSAQPPLTPLSGPAPLLMAPHCPVVRGPAAALPPLAQTPAPSVAAFRAALLAAFLLPYFGLRVSAGKPGRYRSAAAHLILDAIKLSAADAALAEALMLAAHRFLRLAICFRDLHRRVLARPHAEEVLPAFDSSTRAHCQLPDPALGQALPDAPQLFLAPLSPAHARELTAFLVDLGAAVAEVGDALPLALVLADALRATLAAPLDLVAPDSRAGTPVDNALHATRGALALAATPALPALPALATVVPVSPGPLAPHTSRPTPSPSPLPPVAQRRAAARGTVRRFFRLHPEFCRPRVVSDGYASDTDSDTDSNTDSGSDGDVASDADSDAASDAAMRDEDATRDADTLDADTLDALDAIPQDLPGIATATAGAAVQFPTARPLRVRAPPLDVWPALAPPPLLPNSTPVRAHAECDDYTDSHNYGHGYGLEPRMPVRGDGGRARVDFALPTPPAHPSPNTEPLLPSFPSPALAHPTHAARASSAPAPPRALPPPPHVTPAGTPLRMADHPAEDPVFPALTLPAPTATAPVCGPTLYHLFAWPPLPLNPHTTHATHAHRVDYADYAHYAGPRAASPRDGAFPAGCVLDAGLLADLADLVYAPGGGPSLLSGARPLLSGADLTRRWGVRGPVVGKLLDELVRRRHAFPQLTRAQAELFLEALLRGTVHAAVDANAREIDAYRARHPLPPAHAS